MRTLIPAGLGLFLFWAAAANASVYLSLSGSDSTSNGGLQTYGSVGGSASVQVDLTQFLRVGYTYKQEHQSANGYAGVAPNQCTDVTGSLTDCQTYSSSTQVVANSIDFTLFLHQGPTFMPFLLGGAVKKDYQTKTSTGPVQSSSTYSQPVPVPNGGAGVGIRLNRELMFKVTYTVSPGEKLVDPTTKRVDKVLDRETDIGITYQL